MTTNKGGRKYAMKGKKLKEVLLQAFTMMYPATCWIEKYSVPEARANLVANQVGLACLTRYWHTRVYTAVGSVEYNAIII